ncbi:hypothetical protein JB92DRAFT_2680050, partial [Gautieria morchelliformis]
LLSICVDDRCRNIFEWLAAPDHQLSHTSAQKKRQPETGLWFVRGETFKAWRDLPHSTLWLHGKMGSGKTILCSTIINELFLPCGRDQLPAVAYFYFTNKQTQTNVAVRSLIKQLSLTMTCRREDIPAALASLYSQHSQGQQSLTLETLISTLKSLIGSIPQPYIVLDAIEECEDRDELLGLIQEIYGFGSLHLLATSRDELDITDEKVETNLINGAHGMFRWVVCQLDALGKCCTLADIETASQSLPRTLYEMYDKILLNIPEEDRQSALKVLQWLAFSVCAISLAETVEILATNPHTTDPCLFSPNKRLLNPREILTICSSLVTIPEDKNAGRSLLCAKNREEVILAHFSVKEYLISEHVRGGCASVFYFNQHMADTVIAETCLAYLLQFDKPFPKAGFRLLHRVQDYPLSQYAAKHWTHHAQSACCSLDTLQRLILALLNAKEPMFTNWLMLHDPDHHFVNMSVKHHTGGPLYYASITGLEITSQLLLDQGADINAVGGKYGTALQAAVSGGRKKIVWSLLEHGADVNAKAKEHGTALQTAVSRGNTEIV